MSKIPTGYARKLAQNYRDNKLGQRILDNDSRAVWFPKETILEALGLEPGTTTEFSGLRFYLGAYEDKDHAPEKYPKNRLHCNKITLVIVATKEIQDYHKDDLDEPDATPEYPVPFREFNDGQLCPPPNCDPDGLLNF